MTERVPNAKRIILKYLIVFLKPIVPKTYYFLYHKYTYIIGEVYEKSTFIRNDFPINDRKCLC